MNEMSVFRAIFPLVEHYFFRTLKLFILLTLI